MERIAITDRLCEPCRGLVKRGCVFLSPEPGTRTLGPNEEIGKPPGFGRHHADFKTFAQSAALGCHICSLLVTQLTPEQRQRMLGYQPGSEASVKLYQARYGQLCIIVNVAYFMLQKPDEEEPEKVEMQFQFHQSEGLREFYRYHRTGLTSPRRTM